MFWHGAATVWLLVKVLATKQAQRDQAPEADKTEKSLAAMIANAMEKEQQFIKVQFKTLQDRLDNIQTELSSCSNGVRELRDRYSSLRKTMTSVPPDWRPFRKRWLI